MYYDLNIPYTSDHASLQRTLLFLSELSYDVVALNHVIRGKVPGGDQLSCAIPDPLPFAVPSRLKILRRVTIVLSDAAQNHRLSALATHYDIVALRPTDERCLQTACQSLDCDLISLDLAVRYPFHFKIKMLGSAVQRGVRLELNYAGALGGPGGAGDTTGTDAVARRNLIANATAVIRATRHRGVVISSEASKPLACRAPADVVNLAAIWGLSQEKGHEAVSREARAVVVQAEMKRTSFRGVVNVVYGGKKPPPRPKKTDIVVGIKRKAGNDSGASGAGDGSGMGEVTLSKREKKRRIKAEKEATQKLKEKEQHNDNGKQAANKASS